MFSRAPYTGAMSSPEPPLSRRALLRAGAWSAPIIAVAAATPVAAASGEGYELSVQFSFINVSQYASVQVVRPMPLTDDVTEIRVFFQRTSGEATATIPIPPGWALYGSTPELIWFQATPSVPTVTTFTATFTGPSLWDVSLYSPQGLFRESITVVA